MKFIGITGGVGAGKSAILQYLQEQYNSVIVQADEVAKELLKSDSICFPDIVAVFTPSSENNMSHGILDASGEIDKARMAAEMFADPDKRLRVNQMIHPAVKQQVLEMVKQEKAEGIHPYFFLEAALLIEEHYDQLCDELWYIYTTEDIRRVRLKESRGYSQDKIQQILDSQLSEQEFLKHCKRVIDNSGSIEATYAQIDRLILELGE